MQNSSTLAYVGASVKGVFFDRWKSIPYDGNHTMAENR
jgi:hypothetical protein